MKRTLLLLIPLCLLLNACNWFKETPEIGLVLAKHFDNKLYKKFDTAEYNIIFNKYVDSLAGNFSNPNTIKAYYQSVNDEPRLITKFFTSGALDTLKNYIGRSELHGFNAEVFKYKKLQALLEQLSANKFKTIDEVYEAVADLELNAAESLIKYNNFVYYGSLNPRKLLSRYYVPVKRPDSASMSAVLATKDLEKLLVAIQPESENYLALQKAMLRQEKKGNRDEQALKTIKVNMERLRWKLPELGDEYVEVNIPDFSLTWFSKQDTLSHMKVCVGGAREKDYAEKLKLYAKSGNLDDKPKNHETPILYSKLNSIQVNPIWNIPVSIARNEIYWQAVRDPYYLSNNNIKVYYKGKLVGDPDTIQWSRYPREKLPYQFKQSSGEGNALGKFKFIFDNGSSIYLHDTNNKSGFALSNRAISHGCVRVERPLEFAEMMVKDKYQYDQLRMEVNLAPIDTTKMEVFKQKMAKKTDTLNVFKLKPKWFGAKKPVPLIINYITAWSQNGVIQFRPDVYGLDETLYAAMKKFM
ncbi:L,D-transpeptidase family protein [Pedobacter nyackensis]|uniref:L,D-transpeptidase catalytic domain n=1 Tax=Pedobacter nyackensis TaxID=475255 RepID=A0A1W2DHT9_9SPHI|nr:L,D-transpeptidase family protein [Pedobacter nyackensis]SMC97039.1 L,D-transpeptidase catalytic domain [Pedobacter nyackensis]